VGGRAGRFHPCRALEVIRDLLSRGLRVRPTVLAAARGGAGGKAAKLYIQAERDLCAVSWGVGGGGCEELGEGLDGLGGVEGERGVGYWLSFLCTHMWPTHGVIL
jgi:hypothetical protein